MIAPPPGRGRRARRAWALGITAYLLALPAGALVVGFSLHLLVNIFGHLPLWVVGIAALTSALIGGGVVPIRLPESGWRIPQSWVRFGHAAYAALFGGILGLGFLTAIPSIGFYALLAWGLAAPGWQAVVPVFGAFGVSRALPLLFSAMGAKRRQGYPDEELDQLEKLANRVVFPMEVILLAAIGTLLLVKA